VRLYLPQKWIDDRIRCLKAKIPHEEIKFRTKHELGLEMIDNTIEEGIPFSYVTMDGFYGENPELLTELESRGLTFAADIAVDTLVYIEEPVAEIPAKKGIRGRKPTVPRVLNTLATRIDSLSSSIEGWKLINVRKTERGYKKVSSFSIITFPFSLKIEETIIFFAFRANRFCWSLYTEIMEILVNQIE
jgi:SRSO17 transposase